jgi:large repetitive protein
MREQTRMGRIALAVAVVVALAGASGAPAGGIADEPCPNARGEQTNTCPAGTVGVPYSLRFVESEGSGCGSGRQTFHLDSGLLPPGLILTPDGTLKGIALETGSFKFYVEMREPQDDPSTCAGKRTQKEFTLRIRAQPWITSTPASPLGPEVGMPFRLTLRARGGTGIFHWGVGAGRLPVGLQLRDDGSIAGTPRVAGTYRFLARARDTESASITYPVTLEVTPRLIVPAPQTPAGKVGRFYSAKLATVGGIGRITWKLVGGRLPSGIRFAAESGTLIGTPRESGTHVVKVEARDRLNAMSTRTLAVVIRAAPRRDPARQPVAAPAAALRPSSSR